MHALETTFFHCSPEMFLRFRPSLPPQPTLLVIVMNRKHHQQNSSNKPPRLNTGLFTGNNKNRVTFHGALKATTGTTTDWINLNWHSKHFDFFFCYCWNVAWPTIQIFEYETNHFNQFNKTATSCSWVGIAKGTIRISFEVERYLSCLWISYIIFYLETSLEITSQ